MDTKKCTKCQETKALTEFYYRKNRNVYEAQCKVCCAASTRRYYGENPTGYRDKSKTRMAGYKAENRIKVADFLIKNPCVACGEKDIRVLQFDHRDPSKKRYAVGTMMSCGFTWSHIEAEIAKCDVRCANCHIKKTSVQMCYWKERLVA